LTVFVELRRRARAGCHRHADLGEELFLSGRRADASHTRLPVALVVEPVRRVGRNMNRLARAGNGLHAAKRSLDLALENNEGLLDVVPVRRWPVAGGICMSIRQNRPAVSFPVKRMVYVSPTNPRCGEF
jgi:hypothetical protein